MKTFFIAPANYGSNLTAISLGLIQALQAKGLNVGYCKPFAQDADSTSLDIAVELVEKACDIKSVTPLSRQQVEQKLADNLLDVLLEDMIGLFQQAAADKDVVIVEGIVPTLQTSYASTLNTILAKSLNADVILVADAKAISCSKKLAAAIEIQANNFGGIESANLSGLVVCNTDNVDQLKQNAPHLFKGHLKVLGCITAIDIQVDGNVEQVKKLAATVAGALDQATLLAQAKAQKEARLSPPVFRHQLVKKAQEANKRIVLPEGDEPRTVQAAIICHERKIARCVLLAKPEAVQTVADGLGLQLPADLEVIDPDTIRGNYVAPLVELRKSKGMTPEQADNALQDTVMLGTVMLAQDDVDGLVSGAVHTTANTVRPALQLIKTAPQYNLVSSVFFMLLPEQVFVYGDCAINPKPTAQELADIAIQSAESAIAFGIEPRVAMISYSTGSSGTGDDVEKVTEATRLAKEARPDLAIDGPLQYDAATTESVAKQKAPGSPVAGKATVFIFPDLNTGNTTYKAVQRSAQVISVGPMLQGLRKPVNDLSRGALVEDIVFTIALTAIQASQMTK